MSERTGELLRYAGHEGVSLAAEAFGPITGQGVLLAHGGGQTRGAWQYTGKVLGKAGFRAVAVDLRGHGESDWCAEGNYATEAFAEDLRLIARTFDRPPAMIGASLGGISAMLAAGEDDPQMFAALVLVDVTPQMEDEGVEKIVGFMNAHLDEGFASLEAAADAIAEYLPHRPRPKDTSGLAKNLRLGDDGRYRWHWDPRFMTGDRRASAARDHERLTHAVQRVAAPVLLVRGRMSELVSEASVASFLAAVPAAEYVDIADAAHMVAGDKNDVFCDAVVDFLTAKLGGK